MMTKNLVWGFRLEIAAQAIALLAQATLAGLGLSGRTSALPAHMFVGGAAFFISAVQVALVFLLWRLAHAPGWLIAASIGLTAAEGLQMASGRLRFSPCTFRSAQPCSAHRSRLRSGRGWGDPRKHRVEPAHVAAPPHSVGSTWRRSYGPDTSACFALATFSSSSPADLVQTKGLGLPFLPPLPISRGNQRSSNLRIRAGTSARISESSVRER